MCKDIIRFNQNTRTNVRTTPDFIRIASDDEPKSMKTIESQLGLTCRVPGCSDFLTTFKGPGEAILCREHQISQREYGGLGRVDRLWTFAREWDCAWCKYNPKEDEWFSNQTWQSEYHKHQAMRATLIGDHIVRRTDGGTDEKSNIQTLCVRCNGKKTVLYNDHQRSRVTKS